MRRKNGPAGSCSRATCPVSSSMLRDELSSYYTDLLDGSYSCLDRLVLNANFAPCYSAGGFSWWWRQLHHGSDEELDDAHLMRMAGHFGRRVRGWAKAHQVPVIDCRREEDKHEVAEEYLQSHAGGAGLFLILVGRAVATVWTVHRSRSGVLLNLDAKPRYINHYSFHIWDPDWGHITIKMSGHPPFGAQIMLNGHEYVACRAKKVGIPFTKEGNCFTLVSKPADLAKVADTLSDARTTGRLRQVCERWIYTSCLCFALDLQDQQRSGFRYQYSIYQVEYSRNLLFHLGGQMEQIFQGLIDRTRARLNIKNLKTIFGFKARPHRDRKGKSPRLEVVVETPSYDLTIFKAPLRQVDSEGIHQRRTRTSFRGHCSQHKGAALRPAAGPFPPDHPPAPSDPPAVPQQPVLHGCHLRQRSHSGSTSYSPEIAPAIVKRQNNIPGSFDTRLGVDRFFKNRVWGDARCLRWSRIWSPLAPNRPAFA